MRLLLRCSKRLIGNQSTCITWIWGRMTSYSFYIAKFSRCKENLRATKLALDRGVHCMHRCVWGRTHQTPRSPCMHLPMHLVETDFWVHILHTSNALNTRQSDRIIGKVWPCTPTFILGLSQNYALIKNSFKFDSLSYSAYREPCLG